MSTYVFEPPYNGLVRTLTERLTALGQDAPIVLCIGSDRLTGDCLGPIVGSMLTARYDVPTYVYGTLTRTVTALNLAQTQAFVRATHPDRRIIAVDASLGARSEIGSIRVTTEGIRPGAASGKKLGRCGDLAITAVVNALPDKTLASTRLGTVYDLAGVIAVTLAAAMARVYGSEWCGEVCATQTHPARKIELAAANIAQIGGRSVAIGKNP